jgi:hypothetical protein
MPGPFTYSAVRRVTGLFRGNGTDGTVTVADGRLGQSRSVDPASGGEW